MSSPKETGPKAPDKPTSAAEMANELSKKYPPEVLQKALERLSAKHPDRFKSGQDLAQQLSPDLHKVAYQIPANPEATDDNPQGPRMNVPEGDENMPSGEDFFNGIGSETGDKRDIAIAEEIAKGNIPEECQRFSKVTMRGPDGTEIDCFVMNAPMAVGRNGQKVVVPATPQLAAAMRKHGVLMPTPAVVEAMYHTAANQNPPGLMPMITKKADHNMRSNRYSVEKSRAVRQQEQGLNADDLRTGSGKTKVNSKEVEGQYDHFEYGGNINGNVRAQADPAHNGSNGHRYSDYSSEFQGVHQEVVVRRPGQPPQRLRYEDALRDPELGHILNSSVSGTKLSTSGGTKPYTLAGGPMNYETYVADVKRRSPNELDIRVRSA